MALKLMNYVDPYRCCRYGCISSECLLRPMAVHTTQVRKTHRQKRAERGTAADPFLEAVWNG